MSNLAPHEIGSIELPAPQWDRANPLLQLLQARHSSREFSARVLPLDVLSTLLWAAFGINRAQTGTDRALGTQLARDRGLFAVLADAAYRYDAAAHALRLEIVRRSLRNGRMHTEDLP